MQVVQQETIQPLPTDTGRGQSEAMAIDAEGKALATSLLPLWLAEQQYKTFSAKAKIHYEGNGDRQDFTAHFRIRKDSVIWTSITALGGIVQVARILISPDSVKLVNYLERQYTQIALSDISKLLPVPASFTNLQNLIVGNVIDKAGDPIDADDFSGTISLTMSNGALTQQAKWNKFDSTLRTLLLRIDQQASRVESTMQYGGYQKKSNRFFSDLRTIHILSNDKQYYLDMNFANVDFDRDIDYPFQIPKNFERK